MRFVLVAQNGAFNLSGALVSDYLSYKIVERSSRPIASVIDWQLLDSVQYLYSLIQNHWPPFVTVSQIAGVHKVPSFTFPTFLFQSKQTLLQVKKNMYLDCLNVKGSVILKVLCYTVLRCLFFILDSSGAVITFLKKKNPH